MVQRGSVIVSTRAPIGHLGIAKVSLCTNQGCRSIIPLRGNDPRYCYYVLLAARNELAARGRGSTFMELASFDLGDVPIPSPPLGVQQAIANYLDEKSAAIDDLIEKKRKLLDLLAEERAALINQAVTKGLDPSVPMKDSGIPWIGEIPEHWDVADLRREWLVIDCKHRTPEYVADGYKVVSTTEVKPGRINLNNVTRFIDEEDYLDMTEAGRKPKPGDIIYSRNASLGAAAFVDTSEPFSMGQDVVLIRSTRQNQLFLMQQLNSGVGMTQVHHACVGSTFKRINVAQIRMFRVCIPPRNEQDAIAEYVDGEEQRIGSLASRIDQQTNGIQEYRQALITATVTGQLDVAAAA